MAAGSNPLARPLVFATQACSAVSGSTHTGLISGSHRAPLITLLMFCGAKTDRETDRQPARQVHNLHFQLKGALALTIILSLRVYVSGVVTHFSHFVACNVPTASYMLSLSSKCTPVLAALSINPPPPTTHPTMHLWQRCLNSWCCSPSRSVSNSSIIITIQKVKHSASSLFFFVMYAFVRLPLFTLISICKSHTALPSQLLVLSGQKSWPIGKLPM